MKCILELGDLNFGLKVCKFYLAKIKSGVVLRFHGDFLLEKGDYQQSYKCYIDSEKCSVMEQRKVSSLLSLLKLYHQALEDEEYFEEKSTLIKMASIAFNKISSYNPDDKVLSEAAALVNKIKEFEISDEEIKFINENDKDIIFGGEIDYSKSIVYPTIIKRKMFERLNY